MDTEAFGLGSHGFFPGFFYGTAGTGYILAKLYEHTKDELFLRQAEGAADYIRSIADLSKDRHAALVRYNDPYKPDLHYLGVCQGPIGTSRLFYQLYKVTGKPEYLEWIVKLTDGILKTGAPRIHSKGYWHTYCYCCGAAGMIEHFLSVYRLTGEDRFLRRRARRLTHCLATRLPMTADDAGTRHGTDIFRARSSLGRVCISEVPEAPRQYCHFIILPTTIRKSGLILKTHIINNILRRIKICQR